MTTTQIIAKCPAWLVHRIKMIAEESGMTLSEAIVFLLSEGVNTQKRKQRKEASAPVFFTRKGVNTRTERKV